LKDELNTGSLLAIILSGVGLGFAISGTILFLWQIKESLDPYGYTYKIVFPYQHLGILMWILSVLCFMPVLLILLADRLMGASTAKYVNNAQ